MKENVIKVLAIGMVLLLMFIAFAALPMNMGAEEEKESKGIVLSASPTIAEAELAHTLDTETMESTTSSAFEWEITPFWVDLVDAEVKDVSNQGEGVYIAVLDTGLHSQWEWLFPEADIADELGTGFTHDVEWDDEAGDFYWGPVEEREDGFITSTYGSGHGTHVTSTITGYYFSFLDAWVNGVAPQATIIPVLVLDTWFLDCPDPEYPGCKDGKVVFGPSGSWEMIAAGITYIADLAEELEAPMIISMSLGGTVPGEVLEDAIDYAIEKGVIIIASAGNRGYDGMGWPGAYPQVISVANGGWTENRVGGQPFWRDDIRDVPEKLNTEDYWENNGHLYLYESSSRPNKALGQKSFHLDVTAPGSMILGPYERQIAWYSGWGWYNWGLGYYFVWGTSMAAPHVAGIAAIVLHEHPDVNQPTMEKILKIAAHGQPLPCDGAWSYQLTSTGYIPYYFEWKGTDYGAGFLQADSALKSASTHAKK